VSTPRHRRRRWASRRLRAALSLGLVLSAGSVSTHAYWSGGASLAGASFSSGTIDLKVDNLDAGVPFTAMTLSGMVPGSTSAGVLTVKNAGSSDLTYTVSAAGTNGDGKGLAALLLARVTTDVTTTGSGLARTCAGASIAGSGTSLTGTLIATGRPLAAGASETLCFQATLPVTAPSTTQNALTTLTLTFSAKSALS
jgi:hypothetical protein